MAKEITLPDLGTDMDDALLINWVKQPGDAIKEGDVIAEVETDKTTVEVEANAAGTILEWKFQPGDQLQVGDVIGIVGEAGESAPSGGNGNGAQSQPATRQQQPEQSQPEPPPQPTSTNGKATRTPDGRIKVSPVARRMAEERGIDLAAVSGSGPGGRIVKSDIEMYEPPQAQPAPAKEPAQPAQLPANLGFLAGPSYGKMPEGDDYDTEDLSKMRTRIAERMVTSQQQTPHFYVTVEVNVDALMALRKELNADVEDKAYKISVNDMIVKAVAMTAREFPVVNRHYYGDQYLINKRVNVGVAVALEGGGLMTVVAHDADRLSLRILAYENRQRITRARDGKVQPKDVSGSTITVSNLGMYDVDNFFAIVTPPEAAILAVGTAVKKPVVKPDGQIGVATLMKITLSADHRTINGAEGGEFMQRLKNLLEQPAMLI